MVYCVFCFRYVRFVLFFCVFISFLFLSFRYFCLISAYMHILRIKQFVHFVGYFVVHAGYHTAVRVKRKANR
jgi:hypothetical protein